MAPLLSPGGSLRIQNQAGITEFHRSTDGNDITLASGEAPPFTLQVSFLRALLEMCGYLVVERENLEAEVAHVQ